MAVELEQTCDTILIMKEGVILDQGTVPELRERLGYDYLLILEVSHQFLISETLNLAHRFSNRISRATVRLSSIHDMR